MVITKKEVGKMVRKMAWVSSNGQMGVFRKVGGEMAKKTA